MNRTITLALGTAGALCGMLGGVAITVLSAEFVDWTKPDDNGAALLHKLYEPPHALGVAVLLVAMIGATGTGLLAIGSRRTGGVLLICVAVLAAWLAAYHASATGSVLARASSFRAFGIFAWIAAVSWCTALAAPLFLIGGLIALAPPAADAASIKPRP